MESTRTETDSFGPIEVPATALWGAQTARSLHFFAIGAQRMPLPIIHALAWVKWAAAWANVDLHGLDPVVAKAIADAAQRVAATEPRDGLWQAQTPQMFRYGLLRAALEKCREVTDEAGAVEALGLQPRLVRCDATNLKVTYPADLALAAMILRGRK